jgi:hypothetical protein
MIPFRRKRPPKLLFVLYTALTMAGTFSFAAAESLRAANFEIRNSLREGTFSPARDYYIECAAEEPAPAATKGTLLRGGFHRFPPPRASSNSGADYPGLAFAVISKTRFFDAKSAILLKLRI